MTKLIFIFILTTLISNGALAACPAMHPDIKVDLRVVTPVVTQNLTAKELSQNVHRPDWENGTIQAVPGRFYSRGDISYTIVPELLHMPDGTICYGFERVEYVYTLVDTQIQIAKEIPFNSCGYKEVQQHELRHYNVMKNLFSDRKTMAAESLKEFISQIGVHPTHDATATQHLLYRRIYEFVNAQISQILAESLSLHARIDTQKEGRRAYTVCNGQIARNLR